MKSKMTVIYMYNKTQTNITENIDRIETSHFLNNFKQIEFL